MEIKIPEVKKVQVIDYTFTFLNRERHTVSLWPEMGDTETKTDDGWFFTFERLGMEEEVLKHNLLTYTRIAAIRQYLDPAEAIHAVKARIEAERKEANRKKEAKEGVDGEEG